MWAQSISARLKPGKEGDVSKLSEQLQAIEQPGSGLLRSTFVLVRVQAGAAPAPISS